MFHTNRLNPVSAFQIDKEQAFLMFRNDKHHTEISNNKNTGVVKG